MSDIVYTVALGGLLHDVGKLMQRAEAPISDEAKNMEGTICPVYQERYSHKHVLWTSAFFDQFASHTHLGVTYKRGLNCQFSSLSPQAVDKTAGDHSACGLSFIRQRP